MQSILSSQVPYNWVYSNVMYALRNVFVIKVVDED